jgi:hypothetical protein
MCGSSFFHRLNDIDQDRRNPSPSISIAKELDDGGKVLHMNSHEFTLYYNSSPSKLDPAFQRTSTLTPKGAEYCRQVGSGIALIELSLVNSNGDSTDEVSFASPTMESLHQYTPGEDGLRMKEFDSISSDRQDGSIFLVS